MAALTERESSCSFQLTCPPAEAVAARKPTKPVVALLSLNPQAFNKRTPQLHALWRPQNDKACVFTQYVMCTESPVAPVTDLDV
jgi:hypothetical protein